jgi:hypothetical protein
MRLALHIAKIAKEEFLCPAIEDTQQPMKQPHTEIQEEMKRGVQFPGHKMVKAAIERHLAMVYKIKQPAALHAEMVQQSITRDAGGAKEQPHLQQNRRHLCPEGHLRLACHLRHKVSLRETKVINWLVCHPGVCICILHSQTISFAIIIHLPRIVSVIKILFEIC